MPVKTITAEIDGQVRKITADIPDDASQDEIMESVKSYQSTDKRITQQDREEAGYGFLPEGSLFQKGIDYLKNAGKQEGPQNVNILDRLIEFTRPLEGIPAFAAGRAAAQAVPPQFKLPVGAMAGATTYFGLDRLLQSLSSEQPSGLLAESFGSEKGSEEAKSLNSLENLIWSEAGARGADKIISGIRSAKNELLRPGSRVNSVMLKLKGTFSQYMQSETGKKNAWKLVEDVFATKSKQESIERSAELGMKAGIKEAQVMTGRTANVVKNPQMMAENIALATIEQRKALKFESSKFAETAKSIARQNTVTISRPNVVPGSLTLPSNPIRTWTIEGPINLNDTLQEAQAYLLKKQKLYGDLSGTLEHVSQKDAKIITSARNLLRVSNVPVVSAVNPATGIMEHSYDLSKATPISFEDAWNWKQEFGGLYNKNDKAATFFNTLNNNIDDSIRQWSYGSKVARDSWHKSKALVEFRKNIIDLEGGGLNELVENIHSNIPVVDAIINDPKNLGRALINGKTKFFPGTPYVTTRRADLQGYKLMDWLNDAFQADPLNPAQNIFNPSKLSKDMSDPAMQESLNLLYNKATRGRISEFFKNLATTQQKITAPGFYIKYAWPIRGGISLAAGLATNNMSGSAAFGAGVTGLVLGGTAVSRLLVNENWGRVLAALAKGEKMGSDAYISRGIVGVLRGSHAAVGLEHKDGSVTWGEIDENNAFKEREEED